MMINAGILCQFREGSSTLCSFLSLPGKREFPLSLLLLIQGERNVREGQISVRTKNHSIYVYAKIHKILSRKL